MSANPSDDNADMMHLALMTRLVHLEAKITQLRKDFKTYKAGRAGNHSVSKDPDKWQRGNQPVSFRNCNPGNLRPTPDGKSRWRGEIDTVNGYANFKDMTHGTRAMLYLLKISYRQRLGLDTIEKIIDRYAPLGDNSEASHTGYINFLKRQTAHLPDPCNFDDTQVLFIFARAIARFESGKNTTPLSGNEGKKILEDAYALLPQ